MIEKIREAVESVRQRHPEDCPVGIILGSGLGAFAENVENAVRIPFGEIPHFPTSSVVGHAGKLVLGSLSGRKVAVMQGRVHYYEGYGPDEVIFPIRVLQGLGVKTVIITNASGGINKDFLPGDLMLMTDHINLMGYNPLRGKIAENFGPRFPDMSMAYTRELQAIAREAAAKAGIGLRQGVYLGVTGPSYETPAEIRMFRTLGADAVGMSTVPEVITARQMGMQILAISCITNMASGILDQPLTHTEVMETANRIGQNFVALLSDIVSKL